MAGKLGEVFVEILGDAAPFADDFAVALGSAGDLAAEELTGALGDATDAAGAELVEGMDEAGAGVVDALGAAGEEAGGELTSGLEGAVADLDLDVDASGAFDSIAEEASGAAADASDALEAGLSGLDLDVGAGGAFDSIAEEAAGAASDAADEFAGLGDAIASEIESGVDAASGALGGLTDSLGSVQGALGTVAGGAGLEAFARGAGDSTAALGRMAGRLGETDGEIRSAIDGITNWTFSSNDAAAGMELLSQRGVDNLDTMTDLLPVWDDYADATGQDFTKAIELGSRALGAFNIPAEEVGDNVDTLTYLTNELGVPLDRIGRQFRGSEEDLSALGLGIDETTGLLAAMQANGMDSRDALNVLGKAVDGAEGDMGALLDATGLTAEEFERYTAKVSDAEGMTSEQAGIANSTATPMERLGGVMENLAFRFGAFGETAGMLAAPLGALGPMMLGLNQGAQLLQTGMGAKLAGALKGAAAGFKTLAVSILTNPIFLIAAVIIGIVAVIWHFRDEIIGALGAAWDWIKDVFGNLVGWFSDVWDRVVEVVPEAFRSMMDWLRGLPGRIIEAISGLATRVWDWLVEHHPLAQLWRLVADNWTEISTWFREMPGRIVEALGGLATTVMDFIREWHPLAIAIRLAAEYGPQVIEAIVGFVTSVAETIAGWVETVVGFVTDLWQRWVALVHGIRDAVIEAVVGLVTSVVESIVGWVETVVGWVTDLWTRWTSLVASIRDTVIEYVAGLVSSVISAISGWVSDVVGFVTGMASDFTSTISGMIDDVLGWFRELPGRVLSNLGDLGSTLRESGKDLIRGLWNGVRGMGTWLKDKLVGFVADKIPGPIAKALGIQSPSTVFAGFGRNLIEGLTVGVEEQTGDALRVIEDFANDVASTAEMGAIYNEEDFQPVGQQRPTAVRPGDADPAGSQRTQAGGGGPQVVQNIYTVDPVKAGRAAVRELRDLAYLSAPFPGRDQGTDDDRRMSRVR